MLKFLLLCAAVQSSQLFTEDCFKFGMDNVSQNYGGLRGKRDASSTGAPLQGPVTQEEEQIHQRNLNRQLGRIVNGTAAQYEMWPFVAMIGFRGYGGIGQFCAGSIINDQHILTAAHCFRGWGVISHEQFTVTLGAYSKQDKEDETKKNQKTYFIGKVTCHENFEARADTIIYDICLIQLTEKIEFNTNVMPVCLPEHDFAPPPGTNCIVAGWGETANTGDNSILQKAIIPIVPTDLCQELYVEEGVNVRPDQHICAGYKKGQVDACQGDSGGPLVCMSSQGNYPELFGIVSFGVGCALPGNPGVYTNVARFRNWIKSAVSEKDVVDVPDKYFHCDELNRIFVLYDSLEVGCRKSTPLSSDTECTLTCPKSMHLNVKELKGLKCFCRSAFNCRWIGLSDNPNFRPNNLESVLTCQPEQKPNRCSPPIHQPIHRISPVLDDYADRQSVQISCRFNPLDRPKIKKVTCKCKKGKCRWNPQKGLISKNVCS